MPNIVCWPVDPLIKVFREDQPGTPGPVRIESARNEYESGQIGIRCREDAIVHLSCSALQHSSGEYGIQCKPKFVGYVSVRENARDTPEEEIIHPAPWEFPDYLLDEKSMKVNADETQPLWLTVCIPEAAPAGEYKGHVVISANEIEEKIQVKLVVHPSAIPTKTLYVTNWMNPGNIAKFGMVDPWSNEHWRLLRNHAMSMASHRQNVILTPITLIQARRKEGVLSFDFKRFDRWVRLFQEVGVDGLIEGGHLGGRSGDWKSGFQLHGWQVMEEGKTINLPPVPVESPQCEEFLSQLLPVLQAHLEEVGWIDSYVQHLADEPIEENAESYRRLAQLVRRYAPKLRRIDANMTPQLRDCLEIWVPVLDQFDGNIPFYKGRLEAGDDVWFYTCLGPRGRYPNRFIDFPLLKVRILHWINFRYGLNGYLHWGYNHWTEDPFRDTQPDWSHGAPLPAGDQCIVYPGAEGPIESIRFEAMRDGIEDYELLKLLSKHEPETALRICESIVRSPTDYERSVEGFRAVRGKLLLEADRLSTNE